MGKLFERKLATSRNGQLNFRSNSFRRSREAKHGSPERGAPRFYARSFARTALQSIVLLLSIVISMMATVKLAQASGIVQPSTASVYRDDDWGCPDNTSLGSLLSCIYTTCNTIFAGTYTCSMPYGTPPTVVGVGGFKQYCIDRTWIPTGYMSICKTGDNIALIPGAKVCPAHSSGIPCTCSDPYVPNPSATECIPEPLTIALHGLGVELMPSKTLKTAYAEVTKSDGSPKSGTQVSLDIKVAPENDGQPYSAHVGAVSPNGGSTDADGRLPFEFTAPTAGGTHTITATCTGCTNTATGTIKVPGCSVDDLPPITDPEVQAFENNPDLSDIKDLADDMKTALEKLKAAVKTAGSTPSVGSAYRPPAYNQHLIDVWKKWVLELKDNPEPACAALKTKIHGHFQRHKLLETQPPVPGSRHTKGEAVDVTISPAISNIDTLAHDCCNLHRPAPVKDPVHFQFP